MKVIAYLSGALSLGLTGGGIGYLLYLNKQNQWRSIHLFLHLLQYILDGIRYLRLPCTDLLHMAANNTMFSEINVINCTSFCELPVPAQLEQSFGVELHAGFALIERSNCECACAELQRMIKRCGSVEAEAMEEVRHAHSLYPKLGFCLGTLLAVVLA